jgi:hypothetical protein
MQGGAALVIAWRGGEETLRGDRRRWTFVDSVDDLGVVDPTQVHGGDREVGVSELTLDHEQRDALAGHLHRMGVA